MLTRQRKLGPNFEATADSPFQEIPVIAVTIPRRILASRRKAAPPRRREMQKLRFLISFAVLAIPAAFGWRTPRLNAQTPGSQISYQGEMISTVDLVARPTIDVDALRPLMVQKAGEPYSNEKVKDTEAALMKTGQFSKVDVEVTPVTGGLRVLFVLQPAYYIGMIYFPGNLKTFTYSRLLNVVSYPPQEPYEENRVKAAVPALQRFFATNGYFAAEVQSETKLDPAHRVVNLVFHVTLNRRAKFGRVEIAGPPPDEAARLTATLHSFHAYLKGAAVKPGKPYDPNRLQAATSLLQDFLGQEDWPASEVRQEKPEFHPESNTADVAFQVVLGPKVVVKIIGAKVSRKKLKELIPIYDENAFDQELVQEGKRNLVNYFEVQGYSDVKVRATIENLPSQAGVTYEIDRGVRHKVILVAMAGNQHFKASELKSQAVVEQGHLFSHGKDSEDLVKRSVNNLTAFYRNHGFAKVTVQPEVVNSNRTLKVGFEITEGPQTMVGTFRMVGNKSLALDALAPHGLNLGEGLPYSESRLDEDRSRIVASYRNQGYLNVTFQSAVAPLAAADSPRVAVTYTIDEGPQTRISQVDYIGQQHTRESFIQRNVTVRAGAQMSEGAMLESESKLYDLGDFDWANVSPLKPVTDQTEEEALVEVHEQKLNSLTYGVGFLSTARAGSLSSGVVSLPGLPTVGLPANFTVIEKNVISPSGSLEYSRFDLRGMGETASVSTNISVLDQKGAFTYSIPQFYGSHWSVLWTAQGERTTMNPLFAALVETGSLQFEKALDTAKTKRLQLRYGFQHTTLSHLLIENFIPAEDLSDRDSFVGVSFIRDTRDKPLDAHKGQFQTLDFRLIPKLIGSSDNYLRLLGQTSFYRQVKPWMIWANNFRLGVEKAFGGSHVPFGEQFFSGGPDTLRGFPLNGAGPQQTAVLCTQAGDPSSCTANITVPTGGRQLVIFNTEGRFPLPAPVSFLKNKLGGVIFYDGGNVYKPVGFSRFFDDWTNSVGFGLRYNTPVGPVRVDVGRNLSPVPGLKATDIFVTLGQSF